MSDVLDIKAIRTELAVSQAEFAAQVGVDQGTVSKWEKHQPPRRGPVIKVIQQIVEDHRKRSAA
jgi:DNA-binding transcriptional regulator YiaG